MKLHPTAEEYLQAVHRQLDAPKGERERLLGRLSHAVSVFCEENPEATAEDISAVFGDPVRCAAELMAECEPTEVAKTRQNKRLRLVAAIAILAALLIASAVLWYDLAAHQVKYVDVRIIEDPPITGGILE